MQIFKRVRISIKLLMPVILLFILLIGVGIMGYYSYQKTKAIKSVINESVSSSEKVRNLSSGMRDYLERKIPFRKIRLLIIDILPMLGEDIKKKVSEISDMMEEIDTLFKKNDSIENEIVQLTDLSIEQSNKYLNDVSAKLAAGATVSEVSLLERAVIAGANQNNNNTFQIKILFQRLKENISNSGDFFNLLDKSIKQAESDSKKLENTPFEQLPKSAFKLNKKIKELGEEYVENLQKINSLGKKIREDFYGIFKRIGDKEKAVIDESVRSIYTTFELVIGIIGIFILIIILLLYVLSKTITSTIGQTVSVLKDISEGEGDLTISIPVKSDDEIGELAEYFNNFTGKLRGIIEKIRDVTINTRKLGLDLASSSEETSAAVEEISATVRSIREKTEYLNGEIKKSLQAARDEKSLIEVLNDVVQKQSELISQSSVAIEEMIASIKNMTSVTVDKKRMADSLGELARNGQEKITKSIDSIGEVYRNAGVIRELISVIKEVADKTNLLAMNAAIEAAHAGDAGKGFAVVADEIKKLAETTGENVTDISETLEKIISMIDESSSVSEETGEVMTEMFGGISDITDAMQELKHGMEELSAAGDQITRALGDLSNITEEVRESSTSMSEKVEIMERTAEKVSNISDENLAGIEEIGIGMEEIVQATRNFTELGSKNAENVRLLENEVKRFKID